MRKKPLPKTLRARVGAARPGGRSARVRSAVLAAAKAELVASGYDAFSVSRVARSARVQKTTIYRRWRTPQQIIMDVVLATAGEAIPIPDTGDLTSDLIRLIEQASVFLRSPAGRAFAIIGVQQDGRELVAGQRGYWKRRFARFEVIFERAIARGQWPAGGDQDLVVRMLTGTLWFRLFVSREAISRRYIGALVKAALRGAAGTPARRGPIDNS